MPGSDAIAQAAMTPQELEAISYADSFLGAEAKREAAEFFIGLLPETETELAMLGLSRQLEDLDFTKKREVAEYFRGLNTVLGDVSLRPNIHLAPVIAEPEPAGTAEPDFLDTPGLYEGLILDFGDEEDTMSASEPTPDYPEVEPYKFNGYERRLLIDVFGEDNLESLARLSKEQYKKLLLNLGSHYLTLRSGGLSHEDKKSNIYLLMQLRFYRKTSPEIGEVLGLGPTEAGQIVLRVCKAITKQTPKETLDAILEQARRYNPEERPEAIADEEPVTFVRQKKPWIKPPVRSKTATQTSEPEQDANVAGS